jgi:flagellar motor protein MotB
MKRCPQCEFIYEDDQSLCDMDGALLVFDSRTLPNLHALPTVPSKPQTKRKRAVPAFATLILALVLGMVYYVSTRRSASQPVYTAPSAAAAVNPVPAEVQPTPEPQPQPAVDETKPAIAKSSATTTAPLKKAASKPATAQNKSRPEQKKEDSKVESLFKKTGKILKKPFKF